MEWEEAREVKKDVKHIIDILGFSQLNPSRIFCYRTNVAKSRSYARILSFPKIFLTALKTEPAYVIEVLAKYFDKLDSDKQKQVLIHELLHIPKNFSGALLPHRGRNRHLEKNASQLFKDYKKLTK